MSLLLPLLSHYHKIFVLRPFWVVSNQVGAALTSIVLHLSVYER